MSSLQQVLMAYGAAAVGTQYWNPSDKSSSIVLSNSNLTMTRDSTNASTYQAARALVAISGKKYWETTIGVVSDSGQHILGIETSAHTLAGYVGSGVGGYAYAQSEGASYGPSGTQTHAPGSCPTATTGDVIMFAVDSSALLMWVGKNGTWMLSGNPAGGTNSFLTLASATYYPAHSMYGVSGGKTATANFSGAFAYTPPSGFSGF